MHQFLFVKGKKKTEKGYDLLRYLHSFSMDVFKRRALKLNLTFFKFIEILWLVLYSWRRRNEHFVVGKTFKSNSLFIIYRF